jgi:hypothetical protein
MKLRMELFNLKSLDMLRDNIKTDLNGIYCRNMKREILATKEKSSLSDFFLLKVLKDNIKIAGKLWNIAVGYIVIGRTRSRCLTPGMNEVLVFPL